MHVLHFPFPGSPGFEPPATFYKSPSPVSDSSLAKASSSSTSPLCNSSSSTVCSLSPSYPSYPVQCNYVSFIIMLFACVVQPDSSDRGYYGSEETGLKVELTEHLFAQDTNNEVSLLHFLAPYYSLSEMPTSTV